MSGLWGRGLNGGYTALQRRGSIEARIIGIMACTAASPRLLSSLCIFYLKVFSNGDFDHHIGIYTGVDHGPCEECSRFSRECRERVIDESVAYNSKFQIGGV